MASCDPREHLLTDNKVMNLTDDMVYAYFSNVDSGKAEKAMRQMNFNVVVEGVPLGLNYDDASTLSSYFTSKTGKAYSRRQTISVIESSLSDNALQAYVECLRGASPLTVRVAELSADWDSVSIEVSWDPKSVSAKGDLQLRVDGGKLDDDKPTRTVSDWARGSTEIFRVTRNTGKSLSFTASIDGQAKTCEVPTKEQMREPLIQHRSIDMPELYRGGNNGYYGYDVGEMMFHIEAEPGTILLPGTATCVVNKSYGRPDAVPEDLTAEVIERTPLRVSYKMRNQHGWNPGTSVISGKGLVIQIGRRPQDA